LNFFALAFMRNPWNTNGFFILLILLILNILLIKRYPLC
jgi:hypothetical protein